MSLRKDAHASSRPDDKSSPLATSLEKHGTLDSAISDSLNNLAACYEIQGQMEEARLLYNESLDLRKVLELKKNIFNLL